MLDGGVKPFYPPVNASRCLHVLPVRRHPHRQNGPHGGSGGLQRASSARPNIL